MTSLKRVPTGTMLTIWNIRFASVSVGWRCTGREDQSGRSIGTVCLFVLILKFKHLLNNPSPEGSNLPTSRQSNLLQDK